MVSYITFIAKILTRQAGLNVVITFFTIMAWVIFGQHRILKLIATMYINVNMTSLNNSGTAGLHVMLLIVIIWCIRLSNTHMEKKSILKFSLSTSKKRYSNSERGRTNCQSITVNTLMYLELIDIVQIVTNLSWVMRFTFYMNVQS